MELSSFQLELIERFRPNIGVFLNLTPDHLDRHKTSKPTAQRKRALFENQTELDAAVLNLDDEPARNTFAGESQVFWFSRKQRVAQGAYVRGEDIFVVRGTVEEFVLKLQRNSAAGRAQR